MARPPFCSTRPLFLDEGSVMAQFDLQEHQQAFRDLSTYEIEHEHDIPSMDARAIAALLERGVEALAESPDAITDPEIFDSYRSLLKYSDHLQGPTMIKLLDSISSGFQAQADAAGEQDDSQALLEHRAPLEMYAFLIHWFVVAAEKVKASGEEDENPAPAARARKGRGGKTATTKAALGRQDGGWSWHDHIPGMLIVLSKVLKLKTQRIWTTTVDKGTFIA